MATTELYVNERLDHLGIVAGVCQEIGLAAWLDAQAPGNRQQAHELRNEVEDREAEPEGMRAREVLAAPA